MRKFFSFRSSSSGNENDNCAPSDLNKSKKVHSGATEQINTKTSNHKKIYGGFQTPEDYVLKPLNQNLHDEISSNPCLRRSLSFSSANVCSHLKDESFASLSDLSRLTSCHDNDQLVGQHPLQCYSSFPDRCVRLERDNIRSNAIDKPGSPSSFGVYQHSPGSNSTCGSPIPLRCRTTHSSIVSSQSNVLDLHIDEEHEFMKIKNDVRKRASDTGEDAKVAENCKFSLTGRPPRAVCSAASSSPCYSTDNLRTYSFREIKDKRHSSRDWASDDLDSASQQKYLESNIARTSGFLGKTISGTQVCNSLINTPAEDIYEDSSDGNTLLNSVGSAHGCSFDLLAPDKKLDDHWFYEPSDIQRKVPFSRKGRDELVDSEIQGKDTNEGLLQKLKKSEEMYRLFSEEDSVSEKPHHGSLNSAALLQDIIKTKQDRRLLVTELSLQIRSRLAERSLAKESLKQSKLELNTRTRRLEKEKNELKLSLENELDRRSNEWSLKLSKFQAEEQRLRERVRELAEQNVTLQREISWFQGNDLENRNNVVDFERQLNESRASQEKLKTENYDLHQSLLELQLHCKESEEKQDHLRSSFKDIERENMELQKLVGRLQRACSEQDKTISGLRQSYSSEIKNKLSEGDNVVVQLETEKMRLTGVEQKLRWDLESCRNEVESLQNENIHLLNRLQGTGDGYGFSFARLNLELHSWVESLKMQSLSLLDDSINFCGHLIDFNAPKCSGAVNDTDEYSAVELTLKYQNLTRAIGCFRRNLQILSSTLEETSSIQASKCVCQTTEIDPSKHQKGHRSQDDVEFELKAETILTRVLREKICSRELENEQLNRDLTSSIRGNDLLRTDIQRLQDEVSCLSHKKREMEIRMLKKDENLQLLQQECQECSKDLSATRSMLTNVSEERSHMWEEMKHLRENIMLMNCEIKSLHKKIEMLDEDILYKEGQISILKDNLANKTFDNICSPNSVKVFNVQ